MLAALEVSAALVVLVMEEAMWQPLPVEYVPQSWISRDCHYELRVFCQLEGTPAKSAYHITTVINDINIAARPS